MTAEAANTVYVDYRYKFSDLAQGIAGLNALGAAGAFETIAGMNALGEWRDSEGNVVNQPYDDNQNFIPTWRGGKGTPAQHFNDPEFGEIDIPQTGDGSSWYIAVRTGFTVTGFDPSAYAMTEVSYEESASVLGVWAGG